jgi:hypothetical protein
MAHHRSAIVFGRKYLAKEEKIHSEYDNLTITRVESPFKTGNSLNPL